YLSSRMGPRAKGAVRGAGSWLGVGLAALTSIWAAQSYGQAKLQEIPGVSISGGVFALVLAVSMAIIVFDRLIRVWERGLREAAYGLGVALVVGAVVAVAAHLPVMTSSQDAAVLLATVLAVIVILLGLPVTVGLLLFLVTFILAGHNVASFV